MEKQKNKHKISDNKHFSPTFLLLAVTFCVCLIISNLMEIKTVMIGPLTITAGVVVFPLSYIINDCIVEIYGFAKARLVIWLGFAMNLIVTLLLQVGIWLPGSPSWEGQTAMELMYGAVPRIFIASFTAFLCGSMINAYVMSRMKGGIREGQGFTLRAIVSTLWGETVDSAIFFPLAFGGILPWSMLCQLTITQVILKTLYEILILPVTLQVVKKLRKIEGGETDDRGISYKWWQVTDF